jgi:hypothetical protein
MTSLPSSEASMNGREEGCAMSAPNAANTVNAADTADTAKDAMDDARGATGVAVHDESAPERHDPPVIEQKTAAEWSRDVFKH